MVALRWAFGQKGNEKLSRCREVWKCLPVWLCYFSCLDCDTEISRNGFHLRRRIKKWLIITYWVNSNISGKCRINGGAVEPSRNSWFLIESWLYSLFPSPIECHHFNNNKIGMQHLTGRKANYRAFPDSHWVFPVSEVLVSAVFKLIDFTPINWFSLHKMTTTQLSNFKTGFLAHLRKINWSTVISYENLVKPAELKDFRRPFVGML